MHLLVSRKFVTGNPNQVQSTSHTFLLENKSALNLFFHGNDIFFADRDFVVIRYNDCDHRTMIETTLVEIRKTETLELMRTIVLNKMEAITTYNHSILDSFHYSSGYFIANFRGFPSDYIR
jgi:hypothetical protein